MLNRTNLVEKVSMYQYYVFASDLDKLSQSLSTLFESVTICPASDLLPRRILVQTAVYTHEGILELVGKNVEGKFTVLKLFQHKR